MTIRVCFINFWPGAFDSANNVGFLIYLFSQAFGTIERTDDVHSASVVVSSVFGREPSPAHKTIQYIGENARPNFAVCRYALSFDYDSYCGRNQRLPLWWWRLNWPGFERMQPRTTPEPGASNHGFEPLIEIDALLRPRPLENPAARQFLVLVAGNPEPLRIALYMAMQGIGPTVGYGNMFRNPLRRSKFEVLSQFRFCLCPENGIYPGYHTEKLVDAWYGGCVPLYSGDRMLDRDFNPRALVNYQDVLQMDAFIESVRRLENDPEAYRAVHGEPLLLARPSLTAAVQFLRAAVAEIQRTAQ